MTYTERGYSMNELIAMWEARANSENDPKVALAIMQCVGELKASQEPKEPSEYDKFLDAIDNSPYAKTISGGVDFQGRYHEVNIHKPTWHRNNQYVFIVRPDDTGLMATILEQLEKLEIGINP